MGKKSTFHSVGVRESFCHSDFTWNQNDKICHFNKFRGSVIYQIKQSKAPKMAKMAVLDLLYCPKLISSKIWVTGKFLNFHTVHFTHCGNYRILLLQFFRKNFVKLIWRKKIAWYGSEFLVFTNMHWARCVDLEIFQYLKIYVKSKLMIWKCQKL